MSSIWSLAPVLLFAICAPLTHCGSGCWCPFLRHMSWSAVQRTYSLVSHLSSTVLPGLSRGMWVCHPLIPTMMQQCPQVNPVLFLHHLFHRCEVTRRCVLVTHDQRRFTLLTRIRPYLRLYRLHQRLRDCQGFSTASCVLLISIYHRDNHAIASHNVYEVFPSLPSS